MTNINISEEAVMTYAQIDHMVNRFLGWRLPENFHPDGGISFQREFMGYNGKPYKNEPSGTNLFDYTQAREMIRHLVAELPGDLSHCATAIAQARREGAEAMRKAAAEKVSTLMLGQLLVRSERMVKAIRAIPLPESPPREVTVAEAARVLLDEIDGPTGVVLWSAAGNAMSKGSGLWGSLVAALRVLAEGTAS